MSAIPGLPKVVIAMTHGPLKDILDRPGDDSSVDATIADEQYAA